MFVTKTSDFSGMDALAHKLLERYRPSGIIAERIERQHASIYILKVKDHKEVLRISDDPRWLIDNTAHAFEAWRARNVPAPELYEYGQSGVFHYALMEFLTGTPFDFLAGEDSMRTTMREAGTYLAQMREVPGDGYGHLDEHGHGKAASWHEYVALHDSKNLLDKQLITATEYQLIHEFIGSLTEYRPKPILLHGDYKPKNLFVDTCGVVTAITDPQVLSGDPLWDVATFVHFIAREQARQNAAVDDMHFTALRNIFLESYQQARGEFSSAERRLLEGYELVIGISKVERLLAKKDHEIEAEQVLRYVKARLVRSPLARPTRA